MQTTKLGYSHTILCIITIILMVFSTTAGITLVVTSGELKGLSAIDGLSLWILITAVVVTVAAILAIICSWKRVTCYLHFYQFLCLLMLIGFILGLIGVVMVDIQRNEQEGDGADSSCFNPTNYFEFKMLQTSNKATALLCSQTCPCPQNQHVGQCPGWQSTPYDALFEGLQNKFKCSGWCSPNKKAPFMFSTLQQNQQIATPCHKQWVDWVNSQWKAVVGCISTLIVILFLNVLLVNWRILQICNQKDK